MSLRALWNSFRSVGADEGLPTDRGSHGESEASGGGGYNTEFWKKKFKERKKQMKMKKKEDEAREKFYKDQEKRLKKALKEMKKESKEERKRHRGFKYTYTDKAGRSWIVYPGLSVDYSTCLEAGW